MKTIKHRLILPMQAKGNMGKSIEAAARACWLNQRGIPWQGFDLDGDNRTLSRLFPGQVKLTPLSGQAEDLDELILIAQVPVKIERTQYNGVVNPQSFALVVPDAAGAELRHQEGHDNGCVFFTSHLLEEQIQLLQKEIAKQMQNRNAK